MIVIWISKNVFNIYSSFVWHIIADRLQSELLQQNLQNEDEILIAIAGIKQVLSCITKKKIAYC